LIISMCHFGATDWINDNCGHVAGRPRFYGSVDWRFRLAHFGDRDFIAGNIDMSLNHVLSWSLIKTKMAGLLRDVYTQQTRRGRGVRRTLLRAFINRIFQIDQQAYVDTTTTHGDFPRRAQAHEDYLNENGAGLVAVNTLLNNEALAILNQIDFTALPDCGNIGSLLEKVYNAPANLRYGSQDLLGRAPDEIELDPMGDYRGRMTDKEYYWFASHNYAWPIQQHQGVRYVQSSTGELVHGLPGLNFGRASWIECRYNTHNCRRP